MVARSTVFVSHATADDDFIRTLREALADLGQPVWIDSRELRGGDPLWPTIQAAIEAAGAFAVVVSPAALQSTWVGKELRHALEIQKQRGHAAFPIVLLALDNTRLGGLEEMLAAEPIYIPVSSEPGGLAEALHAILVALRLRLPSDPPPLLPAPDLPLESLVLELTTLGFEIGEGKRRAKARARLIEHPAQVGRREVRSQAWEFVAPLGPIEINDIRWYLEQYAVWPDNASRDRAATVEQHLAEWGRMLYAAAFPQPQCAQVLEAWHAVQMAVERRFSVFVEGMDAGADQREAGTALLALPWELLCGEGGYLFVGAKPVRVRRQLVNTRPLDALPPALPPVRILLVTARPEDDACGYIDHRASALPLVYAVETLGEILALDLLPTPTFPALVAALEQAAGAGRPYHVVHFNGHGVYSHEMGLGGLCFEDARDQGQLERRRHETVYTDKLGEALRDHRIPLVFLEACQTAQAEAASGSVASELLQAGVASVVAMTHSVLVETARRFVEVFYARLAAGARVGEAMLAGQQALYRDSFRAQVFGAGELRLQDWFVPVLFQEDVDPRLFARVPSLAAREASLARLKTAFGALPDAPETGFVGRSRELLALERLLFGQGARYAVIIGNGGEGKTALAAELGRWLVRSRRVGRAGFVSVERDGNAAAVVNALLAQWVPGAALATAEMLEPACLAIERVLRERACVLVVDNLESLLPPPWWGVGEALAAQLRADLEEILALCGRFNAIGETRLLLTSREALPAPFAAAGQVRRLHRLGREDAVRLVERVLRAEFGLSDALRVEVEQLVDAVQGHARTLALLAPSIRALGVERTRVELLRLMAAMDREFPGQRERSLFASLELSLARLSPGSRERVRVLGVFHGEVDLDVLRVMMDWPKEEVSAFGAELTGTGLAIDLGYGHLRLDPALCPYLHDRLEAAEREELESRWMGAMRGFVGYLSEQRGKDIQQAATLTGWELPNLMVLLDRMGRISAAADTVDLCSRLFGLLKNLGKPKLLERIAAVREAATKRLDRDWSHAHFQAQRIYIEHALDAGRLQEALSAAQALHAKALAAGEDAYPNADYDCAGVCWLLGWVLKEGWASGAALLLLKDAQQRFERVEQAKPGCGAERMASVALTDQGDCLCDLGQYDPAVAAYEEGIRRSEKLDDRRQVAVGKLQLGTVRLRQRRYPDALAAYEEARDTFAGLDEPGTVAAAWHQIGMVHQETGQYEAAERAYKESLAIEVRLNNTAGQASTLNQLGNLYDLMERLEDAARYYGQAADKIAGIGDTAGEGLARNNLADTLRKLNRLPEARAQIRRAIECKKTYGHAATPWNAWNILSNIETADGQPQAAATARHKALECFLAYRRDGGENHSGVGRLCFDVGGMLLTGQVGEVVEGLRKLRNDPNWQRDGLPLLDALDAIAAGSRDRALADHPTLHYQSAAEIILLLERLPAPGGQGILGRLRGLWRGRKR